MKLRILVLAAFVTSLILISGCNCCCGDSATATCPQSGKTATATAIQ